MHYGIGIDIGGTGIKAGLVDLEAAQLAFKRNRVLTPKPATPDAVVAVVVEALDGMIEKAVRKEAIASVADLDGMPLGVAFPGVVKNGVVEFAPNLDPSWIGANLVERVEAATGRTCHVINDADAAGLAEMSFGAGQDYRKKVAVMTTLGTGIGTAVFARGHLLPFTELGHIEMNGADAETQAAESVKVREGLSYEEWAGRLQQYYTMLERLLNPDVFIVGGGVSKSHAEFLPLLDLKTPIVPAQLFNDAGMVGAGYLAANDGKAKVKKQR
ncbi:polyphosphate--glucose phosphotransferase [Brevibacterium litoralis]|uniref:polyphosphate--glucose phosphotransferase n=1 Tax=Brevibacterium litoralis TaxID=3138935 RepID=UPI0032EE94A3